MTFCTFDIITDRSIASCQEIFLSIPVEVGHLWCMVTCSSHSIGKEYPLNFCFFAQIYKWTIIIYSSIASTQQWIC